jgi:endonuclease/exonuclease/phosphatase family metal-dependent hydrolase
MAKAFTLVSWNVEHFKNDDDRVPRVIDLLNAQNPDVFGLYEVEGKVVFNALVTKMPNYTFHITEGEAVQEILVGVRSNITSFFTQKLDFKSGVSSLRPGALVTLTISGKHYPILFLHTKSGDDPRGLGLRDDMLVRACEFRRILDKSGGAINTANYMFIGDLNTMGMRYRHVPNHNIAGVDEVTKLQAEAARFDMRVLTKDEPFTWSNGSTSSIPSANLDHVVAADHLAFRKFNGADVTVKGWPKEPNALAKDEWIKKHSDHGILVLEVQKV